MAQKLIIVGRAHAGKNRLARLVSEKTGVPLLKTSTDRPRRWPGEDSYHFYTKSESIAIPMSEKLLYTEKVDGHGRWADRSEFLSAGIAILDPSGAVQAARIWQANGHAVKAVYVIADQDARKASWTKDFIENGGDGDQADEKFAQRETVESRQFDAVEQKIAAGTPGLVLFNADDTETFTNEFKPGDMDALAVRLAHELAQYDPRSGGYRKFQEREKLILEPEDWTESEWAAIMKLLGLEPGVTVRAVADLASVECYIEPDAKNQHLPEPDPGE